MHCVLCLVGLMVAAETPFPDWRSEMLGDRPLPASVGQRLTADELARIAQGRPIAPYAESTAGMRAVDGTLWVGSPRGLMRLVPGEKRWRLFHSRRWLPDDHVLDLALAADGSVWVRTRGGTGRLLTRSMTLDAKVAEVHAALRRHHVWRGLVKRITLNRPGDLAAGCEQPSDDNDGLWTSLYVAAEAFRYGVTGDPEAKRNAWESLQALMFLEKISGIPGFVARSYVPREEGDPVKRHGGEWHPSADGRWWWKGDTSSDEVVGHYFAYAVYYDVAATEDEKRQIRPIVARITDHIIDHGFYYVGPPGKPTTWGVWAPEQLNRNLRRAGDRGLNSLEVLSHLKVAEHITGRPRYATAARELDEKHGYAINTILQKMDWPAELVNHSDDELAFLAYYPLLRYERDERRRAVYSLSVERSWHIERPEGSPLWAFIYATGRQANQWTDSSQRPPQAFVQPERYDRAACLEWFRDVPVDTIRWPVRNSDRRDLVGRAANRFGRSQALEVLPISERMMLRWNADPYELDQGGDGRERGDGVFILLPYWLGRYHRLLD